jgi:hypothetical protein
MDIDRLLGRTFRFDHRDVEVTAWDSSKGLKLWSLADRSACWVSFEFWDSMIAAGLEEI